jgi:hypothetical protein
MEKSPVFETVSSHVSFIAGKPNGTKAEPNATIELIAKSKEGKVVPVIN